jgi:ABC-2 type transport system permease protein
MRPIHLAIKDLRQLLKDSKLILFYLVMPIAFSALFGILIGGQGQTERQAPLVAWVDQDQSDASAGLAELLRRGGTLRLQAMSQSEAEQAVGSGEAAAAVTVPPGTGRALEQGLPAAVSLLVADSASAGAQLVARTLEAALTRLTAAARAALLSVGESAAWEPFADEDASHNEFRVGLLRASELWAAPALSLRLVPAEARATPGPRGFSQSSPGILVQFTIANLMGAATALVLERKSGTLRRLLTTPISRAGVIAGKTLAVFTFVLVQGLILVTVGQVAFGVNYFGSPLATLAVLLSLSFCMAALGLLVGTLVTSEGAAGATIMVLMFVLSGLGGAWFPLEVTGPAFAAAGRLLPSAWAMDGFHSVILRGAGLGGVLLPVGVLLAYGLGLLGLAVWRFRFE